METGRIVLITGAPGTGKTTVSAQVAAGSAFAKSVHLHTDDFYHCLAKGAIPPHLPQSHGQNLVVIEAFLAAARRFAQGGYDVVVDGIVGPWFLGPWLRLAGDGFAVHYIVLQASRRETLRRALGRAKLGAAANRELVEAMWEPFQHLGPYCGHGLETTDLSAEETVSRVRQGLAEGAFLLRP